MLGILDPELGRQKLRQRITHINKVPTQSQPQRDLITGSARHNRHTFGVFRIGERRKNPLLRNHDAVANDEWLYMIFLELEVGTQQRLRGDRSQAFRRRVGLAEPECLNYLPTASIHRRILALIVIGLIHAYASDMPRLGNGPMKQTISER